MENAVEKLVKEMLEEINQHIASWLGLYSMGPFYKILESVWEWSGVRTRFESRINAQIAEEIRQITLSRSKQE